MISLIQYAKKQGAVIIKANIIGIDFRSYDNKQYWYIYYNPEGNIHKLRFKMAKAIYNHGRKNNGYPNLA